TWIARRYVGNGKYQEQRLGIADDKHDADGVEVLTFGQAQEAARRRFANNAVANAAAGPMTVRQACRAYVDYAKAELSPKQAVDIEGRLEMHVLSKPLADQPVVELTKTQLEAWRNSMVRRDEDDPDVERRSKDTANRVAGMFRAALNRAFRDDA